MPPIAARTCSPGDELPHLGLTRARLADLREEPDRPLQVAHRAVLVTGRPKQVREVVVQRRGPMTVAQRFALGERELREGARPGEVARLLECQGEIVERGGMRLAVTELARERDAHLEVGASTA